MDNVVKVGDEICKHYIDAYDTQTTETVVVRSIDKHGFWICDKGHLQGAVLIGTTHQKYWEKTGRHFDLESPLAHIRDKVESLWVREGCNLDDIEEAVKQLREYYSTK